MNSHKSIYKTHIIVFLIFVLGCSAMSLAQKSELDDEDFLLALNFKILKTVDTDMAISIAPIIEEQLKRKLKDSTSFYKTNTNLSKHITIKMSEDSLVKTYSWDRQTGGSWHDMASYIQYKTDSGKIKYQRLDSGEEFMTGEPTNIVIYDVFTIETKNETYYLLLGWGTHGGGLHHSLARVYKITTNELVQCDTIFQGTKYLFAGANRGNRINLKYNSELGELSYFYYEYDENNGFYNGESKKETWLFKTSEFVKQD